jgi:hypothetical protein
MSLLEISLKPGATGCSTPNVARMLCVVSAVCWSLGVSAFLGLLDLRGKTIRRALYSLRRWTLMARDSSERFCRRGSTAMPMVGARSLGMPAA